MEFFIVFSESIKHDPMVLAFLFILNPTPALPT
jgi:hypothetical protein